MSTAQEKGNLQVKKYLCVVCRRKTIVESRIEHPCDPDAVPDVGGCDYSTYTDHKIEDGWLLEKRPNIPWEYSSSQKPKHSWQESIPKDVGGICNDCLTWDVVVKLKPHIRFADLSSFFQK